MGNLVIGFDVAATPGKVVMLRNALVELIQYAPATDKQAFAEPTLIVPAWTMYYLHSRDVGAKLHGAERGRQGHTVFIVSWKNPNAGDRGFGMEDYLKLGIMIPLRQYQV